MKENIKKVHRIEIDKRGALLLQKYVYEDEAKTVPCPFNKEKQCGAWCIHFGDVEKKESEDSYSYEYNLRLSCGCGVIIKADWYDDYEE